MGQRMPVRIHLSVAFLLVALSAGMGAATAQTPTPGWQATPWADSVMLQTQLRFDLESPDGSGVSDQQWTRFVADTILPRFKDGITVLNAQAVTGTGSAATRVVVIINPNTPDAAGKFSEIKAAYAQRFGGAKVYQLDFPVRITN